MILVPTNVTAPAIPPVYKGWNYVQQPSYSGGYTTVTMPSHSAGDILLSYYGAFGNPLTNNPPAAGGTVPTWTLATSGTNGAVWWARATSSNHTSGSWYTAHGWVHSMVVVSGAKATGSPIGGSASAFYNGSGTYEAPAVTMTNQNGSSLLITLFYTQNSGSQSVTPTMTAPTTGYTRQASTGWIASNGMGIYAGVITKDVSTSDGAFSLGSNPGTFPFAVSTPCQVEILGP